MTHAGNSRFAKSRSSPALRDEAVESRKGIASFRRCQTLRWRCRRFGPANRPDELLDETASDFLSRSHFGSCAGRPYAPAHAIANLRQFSSVAFAAAFSCERWCLCVYGGEQQPSLAQLLLQRLVLPGNSGAATARSASRADVMNGGQ